MDSGIEVHIRVRDDGNVEVLNGDDFDWTELGLVSNQRVASVEFDTASQRWFVREPHWILRNISPPEGHKTRAEALEFEARWAAKKLGFTEA